MSMVKEGNAREKNLVSIQQTSQALHYQWLEEALHLTKVTVGFSAPVAGRSLMYFNVALYESSLLILPDNTSLSSQLNGFERQTWPLKEEVLDAHLVNNFVAYSMLTYLYANMPPSERERLDVVYQEGLKKFSKGLPKKEVLSSLNYAERLTEELIQWSKLDGGDKAYDNNFPKSYILPECDSCWTRTYPGYKFALQPYWGKNKLMLIENGKISSDIPYIGFSSDSNSLIYKEALSIYELYTTGTYTKEMKTIADYWNDAPGYSGTPSGHFFALALHLSKERQQDFKSSSELFAALGIALNDALIETFRLKYEFNLLRPITYISKYIGEDFNTVIPSPPFPEFPSGHSYQSGAGSEVLKHFLSDDFSFTDFTNEDRLDKIGAPRSFENITAMAEEISLSRFYGGIHFLYTLDTSLEYGRKIGLNTVALLNFEK